MAAARGYRIFRTALGECGIAWSDRGVLGVQLPEARESGTRARLSRRFPGVTEGAPPAAVGRAIDGIAALLAGSSPDLAFVALDMDAVPPFHRRVYDASREIGPGSTTTYGALAARIGAPGAARAVGQALARNPFAPVVPCHRVLAANGRIGGFSAAGGIATKLRLLALEGAGTAGDAAADLFAADDDERRAVDREGVVAYLRAADPALGRLIEAVGPFAMEQKPPASVFAALCEAIVYQQLNGRAAETIFARLRALFPDPHRGGPTAEQILRAPQAKLRSAGLSANKVASLRDLARRTAAGEIPTLGELAALDDEAIVERLTVVRGVGRWTVEMLLMFRLGRPDVLPVDDYGIRKGYAATFRLRDLPSSDVVLRRGERWRPHRTAASWYLWRAADRV
jgi:methylated-DNA-[protein]-cysteine S-methyltransferase